MTTPLSGTTPAASVCAPETVSAVPAALLEAARTDPETAMRLLRADPWDDDVLRTALAAEIRLQLGWRDAFNCAFSAHLTAAHEEPQEPSRILLTYAVLADAASCHGNPATPRVCLQYRQLARTLDQPQRALLAEALYAVAVHHHRDCAHGIDLMTDLYSRHRHRYGDSGPVNRMLVRALEAMTDHHDHPPSPPPPDRGGLTPMPGGLLHPDPAQPLENCLADRVRTHLCHDRRTGTAATGPQQPPHPASPAEDTQGKP